MIKPKMLKPGDTVAIVSLSSGLAGEEEIMWRTKQGIKRLEDVFGLKVKIMPHALKGIDYLYDHPKKRAADLHAALLDPEVRGIICAIGGNESIRLLPYIDFDIIRQNPKVFSGYSDTTVQHLMFYKAGVSSSYGPALLTDFAENVEMDDYTVEHIKKAWFQAEPIGVIENAEKVHKFGLSWDKENQDIAREFLDHGPYESINGIGKAQGHLIGGCFESLSNLRGISLFPDVEAFEGAILFLETCEEYIPPITLEDYIRAFAVMGIFERVNGVIVGRPQDGVYYEEYKKVWQDMMKEWNLEDLPILYNASFGHNEPKCVMPFGLQAEIDTEALKFSILESAVQPR